jgi:hypothetical protein
MILNSIYAGDSTFIIHGFCFLPKLVLFPFTKTGQPHVVMINLQLKKLLLKVEYTIW